MSFKKKDLIFNSIYNILGSAAPFLIGIISIPYIVHTLGSDNFGLLNLIWVIIGYFAFLDLGLGRGIIKIFSENVDHKKNIQDTFWFTTIILFVVSMVIGVLALPFVNYFVNSVFNIPENLKFEAVQSIRFLLLSLFLVPLISVFRSAIEGKRKFAHVNIIHALMMSAAYLLPALGAHLNWGISSIVLSLLIVRLIVMFIYLILVVRIYEFNFNWSWPHLQLRKQILSHGGWLFFAQVLNPILIYFDRFFLSSFVPLAQLAFYNTPFEMVSRVLVIPAAVSRVLFPSFASQSQERNFYFTHGLKYLIMILFPLVCSLIFFSGVILKIWINQEFANQAGLFLKIFSIGLFFNGIANVPFTLVQSSSRPQWLVYIYLIEIPIYLLFLWLALKNFGASGAALVWVLRVIVDYLMLILLSGKIHSELFVEIKKSLKLILFLSLGLGLSFALSFNLNLWIIWLGIMLIYLLYFWFKVFSDEERRALRKFI